MRRLARRLRRRAPRGGWFLYLVTLGLLLCAPLALWQAAPQLGAGEIVPLTLVAGVSGIALAQSRLRPRVAILVHALLGIGLVLVVGGRLFPPWSLWLHDLRALQASLRALSHSPGLEPSPFAQVAGFVWQRASDLLARVPWWGGRGIDRLVLVLAAGLLAWAAAAISTWLLYRRRQPLLGLLLPGFAIAEVVFMTDRGVGWLALFAAGTLALLAVSHFNDAELRWQASGLDYPGEIRLDLAFAVTLLVAGLVVPAAVLPVVRIRPITRLVWGPGSDGLRPGEGPGQPASAPAVSIPGFETAVLPNLKLIGSGPELGETPVVRVWTRASGGGVTPPPYWRGATYDVYTGQGWTNGGATARSLPAEEPIERFPADRPVLLQRFEWLGSGPPAILAANAPERFDQPVTLWERAPGDLVRVTASLRRYTAVSRPPQLSAAPLGAAAAPPPPGWERYLQLPDGVPDRVRDLAARVAGEAGTPYEQAQRLEAFLRRYPYTLDLPDPPPDRDLADYFLFDLQRGYCDYYATAMAVMARAVGLPARLATGYASGAFDSETGFYRVTEAQAHSWVEIYLDGIGWYEFEPTAGRSDLARPTPLAEDALGALPPIPSPFPGPALRVALLAAAAIVGCAALLAVGRFLVRRPAVTPAGVVVKCYGRLLRWGVRLRHPLRGGQTPAEYAAGLGGLLAARAGASRLGRVRQRAGTARQQVEALANAYNRARYAPAPIGPGESRTVRRTWQRLRRWLWLLWLRL